MEKISEIPKEPVLKPVSDPVIGIDLGTTFSRVGVWLNGKVEIIANDHGNRKTPSYVAFTEDERLLGDDAKNKIFLSPSNTVFDAKRLIGRKFDDPIIRQDMEHWPFKVVDVDGKAKVQVQYKGEVKVFSPEEISSMVLSKMKETAEAYLGKTIKNAVITVPGYFNNAQRQATIDAGTIAGLNVMSIVNESNAAALAYGFDKNFQEERYVLTFALGGGSFDVSVVEVYEGSSFDVKSIAGNAHLGGEDFNNRLVDHFVRKFKHKHKKDLRSDPRALRKLRIKAEEVKRTLSSSTKASINIESVFEGINFITRISRSKFEKICFDLFNDILECVEKAIRDARLDKDHIHDVVLVGGSTRIPKIKSLLQNFFGGKQLNLSIYSDEAVAHGAALQGAVRGRVDDSIIKDLLLRDVKPISLGIETAGGVMKHIVKRNSPIPRKEEHEVTTYSDNQSFVTISIYEGEREMTKDNHLLGKFDLCEIPPAPKGIPQIVVTFHVDANGILTASALDKSTNKSEKHLTIRNDKGLLSQQEIEKLSSEAEQFKEEDKQKREKIEARNQLETYIYQLKQAISEAKDKVTSGDKAKVETECEAGLQWLDTNLSATKEALESKQKEIIAVCGPIMTKLYGGARWKSSFLIN